MAGAGLRTVQELLGHKTIAMTCRYAHLAPEHQPEAVRLLDGWGRAKPGEDGAVGEMRTGTKTGTGAWGAADGVLPEQRQPAIQ